MKRIFHFILSAMLAACGGGGGGGDGGSGAAAPAGPAQADITSQNAPTIAAGTADVAADTAQLADIGGANLFVQTTATSTGSSVGAAEIVLRLVRLHGARKQLSRTLVAIPAETVPCDVNGSVTISGEVQNASTLSPGDSITADFTDCDDGDGVILNGGFDFILVSFSQSIVDCFVNFICTDQDRITVDLDFRNFRLTLGAETGSIDGDARLAIDTTSLPVSTATISGDSVTSTIGNSVQSLSAYSVTLTVNSLTAAFTIDGNGTVEIPSLFSGSVTFDITSPFSGIAPGNPDSGRMVIEGANNATINLIALNNVDVQLDIDLDGDGIVDETQFTTWDALDALV